MISKGKVSTDAVGPPSCEAVYRQLANDPTGTDQQARDFIERCMADTDAGSTALPPDPADLEQWMESRHQRIGHQYQAYLDQRARNAPRRYFASRAQALFFLRSVAPTKLVDGAWLYGLTRFWNDARLTPLLRIYLEELGEGQADKNHVLIYKRLLARYGCEDPQGLADDCYLQGALQLALGRQAEHFLPEVIGFNLGYEQLPLHLLITAHELAELDIDPYYFTLHITIDNVDVGHARKAQQSVLQAMPVLAGRDQFYRRVQRGFALNDAGPDLAALLSRFDLEGEMLNILQRKAVAGRRMHPQHSRLGGRPLNTWLGDLAEGREGPAFLRALQHHGWVRRGQPAGRSRFWTLIEGERAAMFGVFNGYERQVIHDWIVGDAPVASAPRRYRQLCHPASPASTVPREPGVEREAQLLEKRLADLHDPQQKMALLGELIGPARHFTPVGLLATRHFAQQLDLL